MTASFVQLVHKIEMHKMIWFLYNRRMRHPQCQTH